MADPEARVKGKKLHENRKEGKREWQNGWLNFFDFNLFHSPFVPTIFIPLIARNAVGFMWKHPLASWIYLMLNADGRMSVTLPDKALVYHSGLIQVNVYYYLILIWMRYIFELLNNDTFCFLPRLYK